MAMAHAAGSQEICIWCSLQQRGGWDPLWSLLPLNTSFHIGTCFLQESLDRRGHSKMKLFSKCLWVFLRHWRRSENRCREKIYKLLL